MEDFKPVPTRASQLLNRNQSSDFKAIVFEEPKAASRLTKSKQNPEDNVSASINNNTHKDYLTRKNNKESSDDLEFDIKRARHEVLKFAMNNQQVPKNKKKMETFLAIKLGAKPPKKAYKNYKELLEEKKRLKNVREERKKFHMLGKNQTGAASVKCQSKTKMEKQKKKRAPVSAIDQHYGKVKNKFK